jgi:hypothetical protein
LASNQDKKALIGFQIAYKQRNFIFLLINEETPKLSLRIGCFPLKKTKSLKNNSLKEYHGLVRFVEDLRERPSCATTC